jgi:hypothetical protein
VSGGTHVDHPQRPHQRRLRGSHPLRPPVPAVFGCCSVAHASGLLPTPIIPYNPMTTAPAGSCAIMVWALPRSLAATKGILSFPRGTEMFQFPRFPSGFPDDGVSPPPSCPIRTSLDRKLPALPQGISSRGHVLHRQPAPRHPPCAHHSGMHPRTPCLVPTRDAGRLPGALASSSCAWVGPHASSLLKVPSVEPRGLEPRTSAVQGRRSPN